MSDRPWQDFRVGRPSSNPNSWEPDCQSLTSVTHVAHVPIALRIAEDRRLRADLVYDESKLRTQRIRVVWFSPNDWHYGFRYGNVRFHFDWATLVQGKRSYWVESIRYDPPACRILLTDMDRSATLDLYDPTAGDGPWWWSPSGEHYWNGKYCLEVMVEEDLDLASATAVDFVKHHPNFCSIDYQSCRYRGVDADGGGAEFIAALVSRSRSIDLPGLVLDRGKGPRSSPSLDSAVWRLLQQCAKIGTTGVGTLDRGAPSARPLARAILGALGKPGLEDDLTALTGYFRNIDELQAAVLGAIAAAVGLPDVY